MKWLVIQSAGEHKGQDGWDRNDMMRECFAIRHALFTLGHETQVWGKGHPNFETPPDFNSFDAILNIENYDFAWLPHIHACGKPRKFYWVIDAHWQPVNAYADAIRGYDVVLHSTRGFIKPYEQLYPQQRHSYFPNGVDSRYFERDAYRQYDRQTFIFIGGKAAPRAAAIDRMIREAALEYSYGVTGMSYVKAVLAAKMQFNKGLNGDINYRNWETIGLGTCLLTEHDPEMEVLGFQHNVNCLFYKTIDEAVALAKEYLASGDWQRIGAAGYQHSRNHSYIKRINALLDYEAHR